MTAFAVVHACARQTASTSLEQREMQPLVRAVFADDRLWLLRDDGLLSSLKPDDAMPVHVSTDGKVAEICNSDGHLLAVLENKSNWTLQERSLDNWIIRTTVTTEGEHIAAIDCKRDASDVSLVTNRRLLDINGTGVHSVRLSHELQPPLVNGTALASGDTVWVGFNAGEWGGGLRRILRSDGTAETVEQNKSGNLCGGPLNTECDPVNGIVNAPWKPSCVVAAIGLVHMMAHGRIVEVCGNNVRRLYFKSLDPQPPKDELDDGEPSSTTAFFGLTRSGNAIWAIGTDGLYRFDGLTAPQFQPLPKFANKGGYLVSFDVPGIVLVMTDVNQRRSLSGSVPIMAAR